MVRNKIRAIQGARPHREADNERTLLMLSVLKTAGWDWYNDIHYQFKFERIGVRGVRSGTKFDHSSNWMEVQMPTS